MWPDQDRLWPGPYVPEWGSLIAAGQAYIFQAPWLPFRSGGEESARDPDVRVLSDVDLEAAVKEGQARG